MTTLTAHHPSLYLGADDVIESQHPEVIALAASLRIEHPEDEAFAAAAFGWVRDEVRHSVDASDPRVTLRASEVLNERVGLCFAKSHLLAAILRAEGIPVGPCYQRLASGGGHVLHGLAAVYLRGKWHRQDPRGNKPGIDARFSLDGERLAYAIDESIGELDYAEVFVAPHASVISALLGADDALALCESGLPDALDDAETSFVTQANRARIST